MTDLNARAFAAREGVLVPSDMMADEFMGTLREGREVLVTIRKPRNIKHHKLLFALLRTVVQNTDKWADEMILLDDLKLVTGLFETRVNLLNGMPYPAPASISFAAMDQDRFRVWFDKALAVIARDVLGVSYERLATEIYAMVESR